MLSLFSFNSSKHYANGVEFQISLVPNLNGLTVVEFPPFGSVRAKTHDVPVGLKVSLLKISTPELKNIATNTLKNKNLINSFETSIIKSFRIWIIRLFVIGIASSILSLILILRQPIKKSIRTGIVIGFLSVFLPSSLIYYSFDIQSFKQPTYTGMLSAAPWLINAAQEKLKDFEDFRENIKAFAKNANDIHGKINNWNQVKDKDSIKILQISDIHNNPAAFDLIKRAVIDFNIDLIVDLGDITDYGTALEKPIINNIKKINKPYLYVSGNHDSAEILQGLKKIKNVHLLKNSTYEFKQIKFYGINDPGSSKESISTLDSSKISKFRTSVDNAIEKLKTKPDVLLIHNPDYINLTNKKISEERTILAGHTHIQKILNEDNSVIINAGTTGGAGIRTFSKENGVPYSFNILYFSLKPINLLAVDSVLFSSANQEFTLQRTNFNKYPSE